MRTKEAELKFRHYLKSAMAAEWLITWHEDRHISPGVPDLHYVMLGDDTKYSVGWLELKAIDTNLTASQRIGVEASQHQYIRRWFPYMPIHFLIRVRREVYLVSGAESAKLPKIDNAHDMRLICLAHCDQADLAKVISPALKLLTRI